MGSMPVLTIKFVTALRLSIDTDSSVNILRYQQPNAPFVVAFHLILYEAV